MQNNMKKYFFITLLFPPLLSGGGAPTLVGAKHLRLGLSDPKTIAQKESFGNLKFLTFGTSRTWGTGLEDREHEAFPFLLSSNATNLGIPAGTTVHPSRCLETMLRSHGDESFDVIVIESGTKFFAPTMRLARRLHQRFPNAIIILLDMWLECLHLHKPSGKTIFAWAQQEGMSPTYLHPEIPQTILEKTRADDWEYSSEHLYTPSQLKEFESLGVVVSAPLPTNVYEAMEKFSHYFQTDLDHYSPAGHAYVASLILDKLKEVNFRNYHDPIVEPWGEHDFCESWFLTGETSLKTTMPMRSFTANKHTLEGGDRINWIAFNTTDDKHLKLFAQYMVKSCPSDKYPDAKLRLEGQEVTAPGCITLPYPKPVHVTQDIYVGMVRTPGEHLLVIEPSHTMDDRGKQVTESDDKWPFRLTGLLLIPEESPW